MSNSRSTDTFPLPHPGIYYGAYPSRDVEEKRFIDATLHRIKMLFHPVDAVSDKACQRMLKQVDSISTNAVLMKEEAFDEWIIELKTKLRSEGFQDELIASVFSLVREASRRTLGMRHYHCQLTAGWLMLQQKIAEMQTGEGKTLTATLPAACAAMAGIPVHVVTVNDYLVKRDAELMTPLYERLGLSVAYVAEGMSEEERKAAYACDITYCTSKQLVFDYLRDRMILKQFNSSLDFKLESLYKDKAAATNLLLRGLNFVIVDEADSVFIDEARTPLILSYKQDSAEQEEVHREAIWLATQMQDDSYYVIDEKARSVELTNHGHEYLEELTTSMRGDWRVSRKRVALVEQALSAIHLFIKDVHYLVKEGEVKIIDENTGRVMPDRAWEAGLHQMIEEKEGCQQSGQTHTLGRISYQQFFCRYHRLSGMSGTASEERTELSTVYELPVVKVPTNKPPLRQIWPELIYVTKKDKWQAIIDSIKVEHADGRPILIGTRTLKDSEYLGELLEAEGLAHQVLNARQDLDEAEIIARAGHYGQITVATNMAGRGTDIKLDSTTRSAGGLHVISCEMNVSSRVDRQLAGRCGRQGDPGSYQAILSLEDMLLEFRLQPLVKLLSKFTLQNGLVRPMWLARLIMKLAQKLTEREYRVIRKAMTQIDKSRESMLAFSGRSE